MIVVKITALVQLGEVQMTAPTRFTAEDYEAAADAYLRDDGSEQEFGLPAMLRQAAETERKVQAVCAIGDANEQNAMVNRRALEAMRKRIQRYQQQRDTLQAEVEQLKTENANLRDGLAKVAYVCECGSYFDAAAKCEDCQNSEVERLTVERDGAYEEIATLGVERDQAREIARRWAYFMWAVNENLSGAPKVHKDEDAAIIATWPKE